MRCKRIHERKWLFVLVAVWLISGVAAKAQTPPSAAEISGYAGLHAAAAQGDVAVIKRLLAGGANINARDGNGRTPLMVAAHKRDLVAARALIAAGRTALEGSWATSRQRCVSSIKAAEELGWQEILRAQWDLHASFTRARTHGWHVRGA